MAKTILAAVPLSRNDVNSLASLIDETLQTYDSSGCTVLTQAYRVALGTLVGLSFTAALAYEATPAYEPQVMTFIQAQSLAQRALAVAEMINGGLYLFKLAGYPSYCKDFVAALKYAAYQTTLTLQPKAGEVERLMSLLLKRK